MNDTIPQGNTLRNKPFVLTPEQREEICKRYVAGESTIALAKVYSVTKTNVRHLLITRGIPRRENTPELHRIYQCNHAYFDQPLDEERAYWIGFLLADGYVTYQRNAKHGGTPYIGMGLAFADIAHVEHFRDALESNHPIHHFFVKGGYCDGAKAVRFAVRSLELVKSVEKFGIIEQKTKHCITPQLPPDLMRHMYRGYVDGDGSISLYEVRRWLNAEFSVVGRENFLKDFSLWLGDNVRANPNAPVRVANTIVIKNLKYGGLRQVSDILHALYDDATIYLERKLRMAQDIWFAAEEQHSYRRTDYFL